VWAESFEITNFDGSSPCAIIAFSSMGSSRMNSAEKLTVDCRMIDIVGGPVAREVTAPPC